MVGSNIFARRAEPQLELELANVAATNHMTDVLRTIRAELDAIPKRVIMARCGGRLKKNSIKQRTRLNRDKRNRERRWAKHAQQFGYRHYESTYAYQ